MSKELEIENLIGELIVSKLGEKITGKKLLKTMVIVLSEINAAVLLASSTGVSKDSKPIAGLCRELTKDIEKLTSDIITVMENKL